MSVTDKNQPVEPSSPCGRKKRRFLSAEKKFQLFLETQRSETPVGEVLRREGLYSTDLARIQRMVKEGALERLAARPGPARKTVCRQDYDALKQEFQDKERVIAEMAVELAILRKKNQWEFVGKIESSWVENGVVLDEVVWQSTLEYIALLNWDAGVVCENRVALDRRPNTFESLTIFLNQGNSVSH